VARPHCRPRREHFSRPYNKKYTPGIPTKARTPGVRKREREGEIEKGGYIFYVHLPDEYRIQRARSEMVAKLKTLCEEFVNK
jgi:hypothetical protein